MCVCVLVWFHKGNKWAKVQCTAFSNNNNSNSDSDNKINGITTIISDVWLCYVVDCWRLTGDDLFAQPGAVGCDGQVKHNAQQQQCSTVCVHATTTEWGNLNVEWSEKMLSGIVANEVKEFLLLSPTHTVRWWCTDVGKCTQTFKWSRSTLHTCMLCCCISVVVVWFSRSLCTTTACSNVVAAF